MVYIFLDVYGLNKVQDVIKFIPDKDVTPVLV